MPFIAYRQETLHLPPSGVDPTLVQMLARKLGFAVKYSYVKTGREDPKTGKWRGKVGEVQYSMYPTGLLNLQA